MCIIMLYELGKIINHTHVRFSSKLCAPAYRKQSNSLGMPGTCTRRCHSVLPCWWANHPPGCGISGRLLSKMRAKHDKRVQQENKSTKISIDKEREGEKAHYSSANSPSTLMGCPLKCQVTFGCGSPFTSHNIVAFWPSFTVLTVSFSVNVIFSFYFFFLWSTGKHTMKN